MVFYIMRILFCRHGETTENVKGDFARVNNDSFLTKKGLKQTRSFLKLIKKYKVKKIYCSQKKKTRKIISLMDKKSKIDSEVIFELNERNWGDWRDKSWKEIQEKLNKFSIEKRYTLVPPKGESWQEFEKRLLSTLNKIEKDALKKEYDCIAIVTYKSCLRALLPALLKKNPKDHEEFSMDEGTCSILEKEGKDYKIIHFNERPKKLVKII